MALKLTDDRRSRIQDKADELFAQYDEWLSSLLKSTPNMDSYIRASSSAVSGFREFIASVMRKDTSTTVRSKRVSIIECVPAVSKKVTSAEDVDFPPLSVQGSRIGVGVTLNIGKIAALFCLAEIIVTIDAKRLKGNLNLLFQIIPGPYGIGL